MAECDIDDDLHLMFAAAPQADDAAAFSRAVDRRLSRLAWLRLGLVAGLGLVGAAIAWLQLGLSFGDIGAQFGQIAAAAGPAVSSLGDDGARAAGLLLVLAGALALRPLLSET